MFKLGMPHKQGQVLSKNIQAAMKWYRHATDAGDAVAMLSLGLMYEAQHNRMAQLQRSLIFVSSGDPSGKYTCHVLP